MHRHALILEASMIHAKVGTGRKIPNSALIVIVAVMLLLLPALAGADYVNFEAPHVHPLALTPSGGRLLAVNTPDATLEVFVVASDGSLHPQATIPVGLEPVTVKARSESEAWVVNYLSDTVSIVDLDQGAVIRTIAVGDEPTDVVFAAGKAFIAVSQEDAVKVWSLTALDQAPQQIDLFSLRTQALAVSNDGTRVYAVARDSGNQTTVVNGGLIRNATMWDPLAQGRAGIIFPRCTGTHPTYPPMPAGIVRNPALTDPADGIPKVSVIVQWDAGTASWRDDAFQNWNPCLAIRLPDHDLFVIDPGDAVTPASTVTQVDHLGTTLFDVSVNPGNGRIYVPNTEALNFVRFESRLRGHLVDNRLSIVDPAAGNAVTIVDLNAHIDRGSIPATNLFERLASLSQPGMMVWNGAGTVGYLSAIGSRKIFRVDGACTSGACIFGPSRAAPDALTVGEGPTGVALLESANRLYVLNRFANAIALVDTASFSKIGEMPLHDPSSPTIRNGRRFLYDGIDSSAHGDAACSSCHMSGDKDTLAWDLGNPAGDLVPYHTPGDNVRFVGLMSDGTTTGIGACDPAVPPVPPNPPCSTHTGFDPQKGPMTTQTLRGMLEPLHWRGDRATMNAFNATFVNLMGTADLGPINGQPAGLSAENMELFRQFALGMTLPPNPYRAPDDTMPNALVPIPKNPGLGNPTNGQTRFLSVLTEPGLMCVNCHISPTGTSGGQLGGINPGDPPEAAAALIDGSRDLSKSVHSDVKIPHLRNMYTKVGPFFGTQAAPGLSKTGFGFGHDGADANVLSFLTLQGFGGNSQNVQDEGAFMMYFPGGVKPSVGKNLTLPSGPPPTGTAAQEALLTTLLQVGNLADSARHCELVVAGKSGGRERTWYLNGGIGSGGLFSTDVAGEPQVATSDLRQSAEGSITFLCATIGSGVRLGADRDLDTYLNGDDCAPGDAGAYAVAAETTDLAVSSTPATSLSWGDASVQAGPAILYDVAGGDIDDLHAGGLATATSCLAGGLSATAYVDALPDPLIGKGWFYLVRARNACGAATFGGDGGADGLVCGGP
jgi:YVTN family beta-propeller protein